MGVKENVVPLKVSVHDPTIVQSLQTKHHLYMLDGGKDTSLELVSIDFTHTHTYIYKLYTIYIQLSKRKHPVGAKGRPEPCISVQEGSEEGCCAHYPKATHFDSIP